MFSTTDIEARELFNGSSLFVQFEDVRDNFEEKEVFLYQLIHVAEFVNKTFFYFVSLDDYIDYKNQSHIKSVRQGQKSFKKLLKKKASANKLISTETLGYVSFLKKTIEEKRCKELFEIDFFILSLVHDSYLFVLIETLAEKLDWLTEEEANSFGALTNFLSIEIEKKLREAMLIEGDDLFRGGYDTRELGVEILEEKKAFVDFLKKYRKQKREANYL